MKKHIYETILATIILIFWTTVGFYVGRQKGVEDCIQRIENRKVCYQGEIWHCWANMDNCSLATNLHEACITSSEAIHEEK